MAEATEAAKMPTRHAELRGLVVTGTNGTQAEKKVRELGEGLRDTEE